MVTFFYLRAARPYFFDDAGSFVTGHQRQRHLDIPVQIA
jgi:hypothetical protein